MVDEALGGSDDIKLNDRYWDGADVDRHGEGQCDEVGFCIRVPLRVPKSIWLLTSALDDERTTAVDLRQRCSCVSRRGRESSRFATSRLQPMPPPQRARRSRISGKEILVRF
jgi:hypothetical protein